MISIIIGSIVLVTLLLIFYVTGKLFTNSLAAQDGEPDYINQGCAIWITIGFITLFCYIIGRLILQFI